jgi:hypothetical protein
LPPSVTQRVSVVATLASAPGCQDHTTSRPHQLVRRRTRYAASPHVHRIPASHIVTTARTPLIMRRDADMMHDFCKNERRIFRRSGAAHRFALKGLTKRVFPCRRLSTHYGPAVERDRATSGELIRPTGNGGDHPAPIGAAVTIHQKQTIDAQLEAPSSSEAISTSRRKTPLSRRSTR